MKPNSSISRMFMLFMFQLSQKNRFENCFLYECIKHSYCLRLKFFFKQTEFCKPKFLFLDIITGAKYEYEFNYCEMVKY